MERACFLAGRGRSDELRDEPAPLAAHRVRTLVVGTVTTS
jgi:hypothetical protein